MLEEMARIIIEELELQKSQKQTQQLNKDASKELFKTKPINVSFYENDINDSFKEHISSDDISSDKKENLDQNYFKEEEVLQELAKMKSSPKDEKEFLSALKERILVLFKGINSFEVNDTEARVELSLRFMEFLLATIDERLKKLS